MANLVSILTAVQGRAPVNSAITSSTRRRGAETRRSTFTGKSDVLGANDVIKAANKARFPSEVLGGVKGAHKSIRSVR